MVAAGAMLIVRAVLAAAVKVLFGQDDSRRV
jgi:hypothetical protein